MRHNHKTSLRPIKGQSDHADAWLMSYADLITLLFMLFVMFVSITLSTQRDRRSPSWGEPEHPYVEKHNGLMQLGMPYDELYHSLETIIFSNRADQSMAVDKTDKGISMDISALMLFAPGSADLSDVNRPMLQSIAHAVQKQAQDASAITVEAYTDDAPLAVSKFSNNWQLSAMRSAEIVHFFTLHGIDAGRISAISHAGNAPLVPNRDAAGNPIPENRSRNQRIVIKIDYQ